MSRTFRRISEEAHSLGELVGPTSSGADYAFEYVEVPEKLPEFDAAELISRLQLVVFKIQGPVATSNYLAERRRYIGLNKALDMQGLIAARFRPALASGGPYGTERTMIQNMISNDHQVLDLNWIAETNATARRAPIEDRWSELYRLKGGLNEAVASRFVGTTGSASNKCGILGLTRDEQLQLRTIQTDAVRSWWKRHADQINGVRAKVAAAASKNPGLRGKADRYGNAWLAIECSGYTGYSAEAWYTMITGEEIAATTLSHIRKRLPILLA